MKPNLYVFVSIAFLFSCATFTKKGGGDTIIIIILPHIKQVEWLAICVYSWLVRKALFIWLFLLLFKASIFCAHIYQNLSITICKGWPVITCLLWPLLLGLMFGGQMYVYTDMYNSMIMALKWNIIFMVA